MSQVPPVSSTDCSAAELVPFLARPASAIDHRVLSSSPAGLSAMARVAAASRSLSAAAEVSAGAASSESALSPEEVLARQEKKAARAARVARRVEAQKAATLAKRLARGLPAVPTEQERVEKAAYMRSHALGRARRARDPFASRASGAAPTSPSVCPYCSDAAHYNAHCSNPGCSCVV